MERNSVNLKNLKNLRQQSSLTMPSATAIIDKLGDRKGRAYGYRETDHRR